MNDFLFRLFRNGETRLHELNYLFWECTTRCNLHCRHCGSDCTMGSRDKDMPLEDFLGALDTIPESHRPKGFTVVLTGGEPLLRPDITTIGREIKKRGFGWSMVSNGYFYDEKMHHLLMGAGMGALTISLDGLEDSHDWMRGHAGSFQRTVRAIKTASAQRGLNFDVVTCVNRRNIRELEEIHSTLESLGTPQWRLFTIIPIGRAASDPDMILSKEEMTRLMEFITLKRKNPSGKMVTTFSCEGYLGKWESQVRDTPFFCHAGINIASVLIDGRINACPNIDRDAFSEGNIYSDNFYEVWMNGFKRFRDRDWAKRGICAQCKQFRNCLGGGMHNWHGACEEPLTCHYSLLNAE